MCLRLFLLLKDVFEMPSAVTVTVTVRSLAGVIVATSSTLSVAALTQTTEDQRMSTAIGWPHCSSF